MAAGSTRSKEVGSADIYFAKRFANNDKKTRDKTLKKLKNWMLTKAKSVEGFSELEILRIWKGLFYSMWFSDKPLVQEDLATKLSQLVHIFKPCSNTGVSFVKAFFTTMGREWLGIDRLRLDKFYFLIKRFIYEAFVFLQNANWDECLLADFSAFYTERFLDETFPDGLKLYISECFLPQLMLLPEVKETLTTDSLLSLVEPFLSGVSYVKSNSVLRTVQKDVLDRLNGDDESTLQIPFAALERRSRELAANKDVLTRNRKILFRYANRFKELIKVLPKDQPNDKEQGERKRKKRALKTKCKDENTTPKAKKIKHAKTEKSTQSQRKVRIELSRNTAVAHKELKISPLPPFSPTRQPNKSSLKRYPTRARSIAADFFGA